MNVLVDCLLSLLWILYYFQSIAHEKKLNTSLPKFILILHKENI